MAEVSTSKNDPESFFLSFLDHFLTFFVFFALFTVFRDFLSHFTLFTEFLVNLRNLRGLRLLRLLRILRIFLRNLCFLRIFLRKSVKYFYGFTAFTACRKVYDVFRRQDLSRKTVKVRCLAVPLTIQ